MEQRPEGARVSDTAGQVHIDVTPPTVEPDTSPVVVLPEHTPPEAESEVLRLAREVGEANAALRAAETDRDELRRRLEQVEADAADAVATALGAHAHADALDATVGALPALPAPEITVEAPPAIEHALDDAPALSVDTDGVDADGEGPENPDLEHWFFRKRRR